MILYVSIFVFIKENVYVYVYFALMAYCLYVGFNGEGKNSWRMSLNTGVPVALQGGRVKSFHKGNHRVKESGDCKGRGR